MRIVAISDVHGLFDQLTLPSADILVIAGDLCEMEQIDEANHWISSLPHQFKVVVPGNHDAGVVYDPRLLSHAQCLVDEAATIAGLVFYGMPSPTRGREHPEDAIPGNVDVLVTHEPPYGVLDVMEAGLHIGNAALRQRIVDVAPRLHVFGHCHCGHGIERLGATLCINASICGFGEGDCTVVHRPIVAEVSEEITVLSV